MKKNVVTMVLAGAIGLSLAACGGSTASSSGTAATSSSTTPSNKEKASSEAADSASSTVSQTTPKVSSIDDGDITIGYSYPGSDNEFWGTNALESAQNAAAALGIKIVADDCNYKQDEQVSDVESMISSGINGLVLAPQDASVTPGITSACKNAGIPVVIIDRTPSENLKAGEDYVCFIGPDDQQAGYDIAMSLINAGCKKILGIGGVQGTSVGEGRKAGLDKALEENPDVELLQYEYAGDTWDDGDKMFRNLYSAHPDVDGVWCFNDSMALATVNVVKEEGKLDSIKVGGMDLLSNSIESMQNKELWFSTGGHYMEAGFGVIVCYDTIKGIQYEGEDSIQMKLFNVDQTTVNDFADNIVSKSDTYDWAALSKAKDSGATYDFNLEF